MGIWNKKYTLNDLNAMKSNTMLEHLQITFIEIGDSFLKASMPVASFTKQPLGLLHGGASCVLAESVASTAAYCCIDPRLNICVGLEINANHVKAAFCGKIIATTKPAHIGSKTQIWHIDIHDEQEKLICVARHTVIVLPNKYYSQDIVK